MLIRKRNIEEILESAYENIKPLVKPKDGLQHILLLNDNIDSFKTISNYCNTEYTLYLDNILENLQKDGYDLVDIKISSFQFSNGFSYQALIIYR